MVQQPVQHGRDRGAVSQQFAPVIDGPVRGDERAGSLVPTHDDFQQLLGRGERQLPHAEIVDKCYAQHLSTNVTNPVM